MGMTRRLLTLLLAAACAAPAGAQVRAVPEAGLVSSLGALSAPSAALTPPSVLPGVWAPAALPAGALPALPAAAIPAAPAAFAAPAAVPLSAPALRAAEAASEGAPLPSAFGQRPAALDAEKPERRVLHSLKDLAELSGGASADAAGLAFDGAAPRAAAESGPTLPEGAVSAEAVPLRGAADVDRTISTLTNSREMHDALKARLPRMQPFDAIVYRDARGGTFTGLDLSARPANADLIPELQPHEVATIKKIQLYTRDLQVLVREEGATPDLVVAGTVTELKSVHTEDAVYEQLSHANHQLTVHAQRHGLGRGAAVLDMIPSLKAVPERIEEQIARVVAENQAPGFKRVYVFSREGLQVYAPDASGAFRLDRAAVPFARPGASAAARGFVPPALERAVLPDMATVTREIQEPSRLLRGKGIRATITVYGSARILPPERARADLERVLAETGPRPHAPADKRRLAAARAEVRMSKFYALVREFGALAAREGGGEVAIVTGGGPGIMEAANRGALEAGGPSVGYNIRLDHEQSLNAYTTPGLSFEFENFSTRKMSLRHGAMGLVYAPGGFGTMDELFEVLTLIQTHKMPRVPIVLLGKKSYWEKVLDFREYDHMGLISHEDLKLFRFAETARQAWDAIRAAHESAAARP